MRKSNFLKKAFSSFVGTSSPHFQVRKKLVTYNIAAFLTILGSLAVFNCGCLIANAQETIGLEETQEVTSSVPAQVTEINSKLDELSITSDAVLTELQEINVRLELLSGYNWETIVGLLGHLFGALFLIIVCIVFVAIYKLFDKFFRF